jgi:transcriptional repressor NrdR
MRCPFCGAEDTRVVDSRPAEAGAAIRRRRACENCDQRFTTYERRQPVLMVRKRDGRLESFDPAKVRAGMARALADPEGDPAALDAAVARIEAACEERGPEVASEEIGRMVLAELRDLDEAAYLRFASVHKDFSGARDFTREMETLQGRPPAADR